ncbi:LAMI_0F02894g1_1 [Lachancea mirantina]|uniref:LAMI_0F02894g1_1 n=1 Tax=Lachancea mirantina TaxID=1230905 RepID=A0A1G4JX52_9SACH|nr:LAMI_0F02894g1_1 [Lachancea mirantina]
MEATGVALNKLAELEEELEVVDKDVELFKLKKVQPIFKRRDKLLEDVPEFWKVVLSQHGDFGNYVRAGDLKYIDAIRKIDLVPLCLDDSSCDPRDFRITFYFDGIDGDFEGQEVSKVFKVCYDKSKVKFSREEDEDDYDEDLGFLTSEAVNIKWPKSYDWINPLKIEDKSSSEGKRNYRIGMKSFFAWFKWTGLKPRKEFPDGGGLASLLSEDIYPHCIKYYAEAQRDLVDETGDDEEVSDGPLQLDDVLLESMSDSENQHVIKKARK